MFQGLMLIWGNHVSRGPLVCSNRVEFECPGQNPQQLGSACSEGKFDDGGPCRVHCVCNNLS